MDVSIIIPNYNGKDLLQKNLEKLLISCAYYENQTKDKTEIIVVDDASFDGSVDFLHQFASTAKTLVKIIQQKKNRGFSSTVNNGVSGADGDVIVLLNTDIVPEKDFLLPLLSHFASSNVFAVGCMDKSVEGDKTVLRGRGVGKWERGFFIHKKGQVNKQTTQWVSGGSGAFIKDIWDKLGGFDPLYNPFYWEDIDLSYRAYKRGWKVLFDPTILVEHHHESTIRKYFTENQIKTIAYRNQFIFMWKNITQLSKLIEHKIYLWIHVVKALLRGDKPFIMGLFQAVVRLPIILKARRKQQKGDKLSDAQVLLLFKEHE